MFVASMFVEVDHASSRQPGNRDTEAAMSGPRKKFAGTWRLGGGGPLMFVALG